MAEWADNAEQYVVSVRDVVSGRRVALARCPVGDWQRIGWWLNGRELIDQRYRVTVSVTPAGRYAHVPTIDQEEAA